MKRAALATVAATALLVGACEYPHMAKQQTGYRGTGMDQVQNPRLIKASAAYIPPAPYALDPDTGGDRAGKVYQNVQVLGGISADEFNRLMAEITNWVAPEGQVKNGGCNYCHNPENMASDALYTKRVARRMLQMTIGINTQWRSHVQNVGVTCWTCHRGNPVPLNRWSIADVAVAPGDERLRGNKHGQNTPSPMVAYASLPYDPFSRYLMNANEIRVASPSEFPTAAPYTSIKTTEKTYGLMMHFAHSLGVNCTYCHNTESFRTYSLANPTKVTAWYGIRMVRQINDQYIGSLQNVFPANRKGPHGDVYKANCATCHQGLAKPMNGVSMLPDNPSLRGVNVVPGVSPTWSSANVYAFARGPYTSTEVGRYAGLFNVDPRQARLVSVMAASPHLPGANVPATTTDAGEVARITATIPTGVKALVADASATAEQCNADFARLLTGAEIQFDTASATIHPESKPLLDKLAVVAGRCSAFKVTIEGHTDAVGSQATNLPLSRDRAGSVATYLVGKGVQPAQLAAIGYGESRPKVATGGASQANRRIEITVSPSAVQAAAPQSGGGGRVAARG